MGRTALHISIKRQEPESEVEHDNIAEIQKLKEVMLDLFDNSL